jgi:hypothetical protein
MNHASNQKHQQTRQTRTCRSGYKKPATCAHSDHDENNLKTFKQYTLESCESTDGIKAFQTSTIALKQGHFVREDQVFIVQGNNAPSAQYRLAQPTHPKHQKEHPDRQLQRHEWNSAKKRPKRSYHESQNNKGGTGSGERGSPASGKPNRQHDGVGFCHFHDRSKKRCRDRRDCVSHNHPGIRRVDIIDSIFAGLDSQRADKGR